MVCIVLTYLLTRVYLFVVKPFRMTSFFFFWSLWHFPSDQFLLPEKKNIVMVVVIAKRGHSWSTTFLHQCRDNRTPEASNPF